MAITIVQEPKDFTPAYSPVDFVVDEDGSLYTEDNFNYICDVKVDGSQVARLKVLPDINEFTGVFQIERILNDYLEYVFDTDSEFFSAKDSCREFTFEFGWEYIDSNGDYQQTLANNTVTKHIFNGGLELGDFLDFYDDSNNPYLLESGLASTQTLKTQTNSYSKELTRQWVYYMTNDETLARWLYVETFDSSNNSVGVYRKEMPTALQSDSELKMFGAQVGVDFLESNLPSDVSGTAGFWSDGSEEAYEVWIEDSANNRVSEKHRFEVNKECRDWDLYNVYYLNSLGGIDSFPFHGKNERSTNINRDTYRRKEYELSASGLSYRQSVPKKRDMYTTYTDRLQLHTEFVLDNEQNDLKDLRTSPVVWVETPDNDIIAANVDANSFTYADKRNNEMISVSLEVEIGAKTVRQQI